MRGGSSGPPSCGGDQVDLDSEDLLQLPLTPGEVKQASAWSELDEEVVGPESGAAAGVGASVVT
jgi:hypothetical protein